jgi:NADH-quinone oxidoreductase subunit A
MSGTGSKSLKNQGFSRVSDVDTHQARVLDFSLVFQGKVRDSKAILGEVNPVPESRMAIVILVLVAAGMASFLLVLTHLLGRVRHSRVDLTPYECGMKPYKRVERHRFSVHFYLVAMLFILFDIEAAFLYPWAITFKQFAADKMFVLVEMMVFLGILVVGFIYVWKRGALEWE